MCPARRLPFSIGCGKGAMTMGLTPAHSSQGRKTQASRMPILTILKVSVSKPSAWQMSEPLVGMVAELFPMWGTLVTWGGRWSAGARGHKGAMLGKLSPLCSAHLFLSPELMCAKRPTLRPST